MSNTDIKTNNFIDIISKERLLSYKYTEEDDLAILYARYVFNIKLSESFYPVLSALEIALRNKLYNAIAKIKGANWLSSEVNTRNVLSEQEREILVKAYNKLANKYPSKPISEGKLIAELTFGFWANLCKKSYKNSLWDKQGFFDSVFADFNNYFITNNLDRTKIIFPELKNILILRNRIFHHEIIINNKQGIENIYANLEKVLFSLSRDYADMFKDAFRFDEIIKQKP